jgi:hypothetical protein
LCDLLYASLPLILLKNLLLAHSLSPAGICAVGHLWGVGSTLGQQSPC